MHHVVDAEAGQDRDQDRLHGPERPPQHHHRPDHRHDGAEDGDGGEDGEERGAGGEEEDEEGNGDADGCARDGTLAVDLLVVHEDELLLQVRHQHPRRAARVADHPVQVLREPLEPLVLRARHVLGEVRPLVQHLRLHLDRHVPQLLAVPPEVVDDLVHVLDALRRVGAERSDGGVDVVEGHGGVVGGRGEAAGVRKRDEAVHHAANRTEASVLALEQRGTLRGARELEVVARERDLALALGGEGEGLLEHRPAHVVRVDELVDARLVQRAHAPGEEHRQALVLRADRELVVQDRDRVLQRVVLLQELLRCLGRLQLRHVHDRRDQPGEEHEQDQHTALDAEHRVREAGAEEAGDSVLRDGDAVVEGGEGGVGGGLFLVAALAASGAAATEPRDLARRVALEAVVIDDDRGAEQGHDEHVVPEDHERREDAEGAHGGDGGEDGAEKGGAGGGTRDRHRVPRLAPHPRHSARERARHLRPLVRGLLVGVHEDEDVVGTNGAHDKDGQGVHA
mmetsp:Transcript_15219/g.36059  ORF Transcript_15219/g.36059 Transcript_15219/m.36059 type:complete len:510 (-) Transcript_15219:1360-2889(-)